MENINEIMERVGTPTLKAIAAVFEIPTQRIYSVAKQPKEGEVYDDSFVADKMDERMEMFGNAPAKECMDIIAFFLTLSVNSGKCSEDYLTAAKSQIDQLLEHTQNSVSHGVGKRRSLLWRMKTLRKLKEYRKCLRQLY